MGTIKAGQRLTAALLSPGAWTPLGTLAGYTVNTARYRSLPNGDTELDISVLGGGSNGANPSFSVTLPPGFALNNGQTSMAYPLAVNGAFSASTCPRLIIGSNGGVSVSYVASHSQLLTGQCLIPTS